VPCRPIKAIAAGFGEQLPRQLVNEYFDVLPLKGSITVPFGPICDTKMGSQALIVAIMESMPNILITRFKLYAST